MYLQLLPPRPTALAATCGGTLRRAILVIGALVFLLGLSGCASHRLSRDPLCQAIALFANATKPGESHLVSLETAWRPSNLHPDSLRSLDCADGGYPPGTRLCQYLLEHSATEFSENNFREAFACLSRIPVQTKNYVTYERLEAKVSAYDAVGVHEGVELSLEFKPNEVNGTIRLIIGATALEAHK